MHLQNKEAVYRRWRHVQAAKEEYRNDMSVWYQVSKSSAGIDTCKAHQVQQEELLPLNGQEKAEEAECVPAA